MAGCQIDRACAVRFWDVLERGIAIREKKKRPVDLTGHQYFCVSYSDAGAGVLPLETQFSEYHVAGADTCNAGKQQGSRRKIQKPVDILVAGQPDTNTDHCGHNDEQHSDCTHGNSSLCDPGLVGNMLLVYDPDSVCAASLSVSAGSHSKENT
jgi:hypothetical protein